MQIGLRSHSLLPRINAGMSPLETIDWIARQGGAYAESMRCCHNGGE